MNVTKDGIKDRQLHIEDYLQMVSAEQKEYAEVSAHQRIAENNDIITDFQTDRLMEKILSNDNLNQAYKKVKSNKGAGGVDGMSVDELLSFLRNNGVQLKQQLMDGKYKPNPVRRVEIPKETKGEFRKLGVPTVVDRVFQQAITQVLSPIYEEQFSENSYGFRPEVEFSGIESDSEVTVSPFNSKQEQTLSEHIEFSELEILQLSEFYEITARSGDDTIRRIIMIPTSGFPDDRESAAVNSVVKDRASFVEYIAFVLGDDYVASMLEGKQMGESGFFANSSDAMPALYEKMLKTSVEGPERIKDIGYVLKMVTDKDIIPDEFRELYETFCNTLKIRR